MIKNFLNFLKKYWTIILNYFFPPNFNKKRAVISFFVAFGLALFLSMLFTAPQGFPVGSVVKINSGESLQSITIKLHNEKIIGSEFIFRSLVILFGGEKKVIAGNYLLPERQGSLFLAKRFVDGQFGIDVIKITLPEGWNIFQIADYLEENLIEFDRNEFIKLAQKKEGYLFPDTYFVSESTEPSELIEMMENNFLKKIALVQEQISNSKYTEEEIIIMASLLEEEALPKDRDIVSGILWKRLEINMPLQVDSTFSYINGKNTYELTLDDLKIDSPYNTYKYKGLPPGPISNPGLESIQSAITPVKTKYLYFMTEKNGTIHYARTFEEHKKNKELYLR